MVVNSGEPVLSCTYSRVASERVNNRENLGVAVVLKLEDACSCLEV